MGRPFSLQRTSRLRSTQQGVSILEVLFAILISAIGLMGAIAVFPAAMSQTRRGQQTDAAAVLGPSVWHKFEASGMRQATRWLYYNAGAYQTVGNPDGSIAYCIDPRFIVHNQNDTNANYFPYGDTNSRMARVTLNNGVSGSTAQMNGLLADLNFSAEDDLAYDRFTDTLNNVDSTNHAASKFLMDASGGGVKRQSNGHLSWMATLSPKLDRMPLPNGSIEDRYVLSIVVFYDRPAQMDSDVYPQSDWYLDVNMSGTYGGGIGGGDMRLSDSNSSLAADERERRIKIHRDQWVMLYSYTQKQAQNGGNQRLVPLCRWYRVVDADAPDTSAYTVDVTLSGADWENTGQTVRAAVAQGVVAVYEKTISLEPRN